MGIGERGGSGTAIQDATAARRAGTGRSVRALHRRRRRAPRRGRASAPRTTPRQPVTPLRLLGVPGGRGSPRAQLGEDSRADGRPLGGGFGASGGGLLSA